MAETWDSALNPYANYNQEDLFDFLRRYQAENVGDEFCYSNVAVATMGEALAIHNQRDFKSLLQEREYFS